MKRTLATAMAILLAAVGLLFAAGTAASAWQSVTERRAAAKARALWPTQQAELERTLRAVHQPPGWTAVPCDIETALRCWRSPEREPAGYRDAVLTALRSAGIPNPTWTCDHSIHVPRGVPIPCYGHATVGGRRVLILVGAHFDPERSKATRTKVFEGADIHLAADLTPPD